MSLKRTTPFTMCTRVHRSGIGSASGGAPPLGWSRITSQQLYRFPSEDVVEAANVSGRLKWRESCAQTFRASSSVSKEAFLTLTRCSYKVDATDLADVSWPEHYGVISKIKQIVD